ncbi:MAG TPA: hypothetical protein VFH89_06095 [Sphingomicrobium sp.]|jgi:hypothetical protein|nr:hypothetical protein [Sphingomicrobium sp.]
MIISDSILRQKELDAYEAIPSLDHHGETIRLILAEVSMLSEKYRYVQRHDVPHVRDLTKMIDLLWQEIEMDSFPQTTFDPLDQLGTY